ncbi:hypothetical protein P3W85_29705 [Cupriavidus basilensis]|uniref:Uncharacterized protein n=1 Tax=Cupriavidus basilensis TaxID=68895 RepID=A0ABT6AWU1_9BURK|nr:hypothetical protein [Cupriavidus basilensis]MDF3837098.1 hypothetical protein [Cupriavidus basilensis]
MSEKTVTQRHVDFARAVVELARQHGMSNLRMSYRESHSSAWTRGESWNSEEVTMNWSEGRHGDQSKLSLEYRAAVAVDEKPVMGASHGA